jgi:plasmid replication initiation protein
MKPPLPDCPLNHDLFICDVQDSIPKDDMASMEHPVFSLSTRPDMRHLRYEHNGNTLEIIPSVLGLATIHDKDILIYIISQLIAKMKEGHTPRKEVRITAYDLLVSTNRPTNNLGYERLKAALDRLVGTRIKTNVQTNGIRVIENFGLIDRYGIIEKSPMDGRMIGIKVILSEWLYNAVAGFEVLTLHRDYFRLRKPMERRIYELARKHCGANEKWTIRLEILKTKIGTTAPLKKFRFNVRKLVETNHLPDYKISLSADAITFTSRRTSAGEGNVRLPRLSPEAFEKAKRAAPGWDVYYLENQWREWITGKEKPKNPDAAFIAFCRKKYQRKGMSR